MAQMKENIDKEIMQTKGDIDKEIEVRLIDAQKFTTSIHELQKVVGDIGQEHVSNRELIRKLTSEEEEARVFQIRAVQEICSGYRWDMEAELTNLKKFIDAGA